MSQNPQVFADAASDAYTDHPGNVRDYKPVDFNGQKYTIFGYKNDPVTGFHATAYQNLATGEVIIAYRGTDPDYKKHPGTMVQDIAVDATMVRDKINPQKSAASDFTAEMLKKAQDNGISKDHVTVSGHSLGGTLAEIEAAKYGLRGITLNAYGAAGLTDGMPAPGCQLTNYRMAGDPVSAANAHIGTVVPLASPEDVTSLQTGRYLNASAGSAPPNPLRAMRLDDHSGDHFTGKNGTVNVLDPKVIAQYQHRYKDNQAAFDHFSGDLSRERGELALALRQMETGTQPVNLPPDIQRQVNEYLAVNVDPAIARGIEQNAKVAGVEHGLQYGADAAHAGGQYVQTQDERLASAVRTAGDAIAPANPFGPLAGMALGEAAHLHGQAAHAVGDFASHELQSAKHVVEQRAHDVSQAAKAAIHNPGVQAATLGVVNRVVDAYGNAVAAEHAVEQSYDAAKKAVSHGIDATERGVGQAYNTLAHPGQWFEHATPSPATDPARHQQRALHGESSQVDRAQEARRQQEIHGHAAAHEAPLPPAPAGIVTGAPAPEREASPARQEPRPVAREQEASPHPSSRHEPSPTPATPDHAALSARQAQQQAIHAQRHAQQQERLDDRAAASRTPGRLAEVAALAPAVAAAAASPRDAATVRSEPSPAKIAPPPPERTVQAPPSNAPTAAVAAFDPARAQPAVSVPTARPTTPSEPSATALHAASTATVTQLSPPLDPPAMRDFRHAEHPLNARYQMFRDALGEQGFYEHRPTVNTVPEVRGYSAEQKDRLAAGLTAQLGADTRFNSEIRHFSKDGDTLLAVERPRELGAPPLVLAVSQTQTLARTPTEHAAAWRARELPEPQAVNTARPDPRSLSPDHPGHPDHPRHAMFEHAREALSGEYARWGIQKGADTLDRETMQVAIAARSQRMEDVGAIRLGKASPDGRIGEHPMLAVYSTPRGPDQPLAVPALVESQTLQQAPPVQQVTQQFQQVDQQATQQLQQMQQMQAQINAQAPQGPVLGGPGMGR